MVNASAFLQSKVASTIDPETIPQIEFAWLGVSLSFEQAIDNPSRRD